MMEYYIFGDMLHDKCDEQIPENVKGCGEEVYG